MGDKNDQNMSMEDENAEAFNQEGTMNQEDAYSGEANAKGGETSDEGLGENVGYFDAADTMEEDEDAWSESSQDQSGEDQTKDEA